MQKLPANKSIFLNARGKGGKRACLYGKCLYGKDGKTRMLETWCGTHTMAKLWETSVGRSVTPTAVVMEYTPHSTIETCCGRGTYQHVSTDRTHPYGAVGVGGCNLVGYAHHWTLYLPIRSNNGQLLGGPGE